MKELNEKTAIVTNNAQGVDFAIVRTAGAIRTHLRWLGLPEQAAKAVTCLTNGFTSCSFGCTIYINGE